MSVNLLSKKLRLLWADDNQSKKREWSFFFMLPIWVAVSFFASQFVIMAVFWLLRFMGIDIAGFFTKTVLEAVLGVLTYVLTLAIVMGAPYIIARRRTNLQILGLERMLSWTDLALAPLTFIAYALVLTFVTYLLVTFIPVFPADQAQDVGFRSVNGRHEYTVAFLMLVVIGPIAEEALFRGYLYGKLRSHVPLYAAMIATSLLFALAHGQWNVAVDTFILSLFLCGLREITGSIWAGVVVHMLKNAIAFYWLFVGPVLMFGG